MRVPYIISGGFAARLYGVDRELADIDIEVNDEDMELISGETGPYVVYGPDRYKDDHWDVSLMTLRYEGQEIDIAGNGGRIFNQLNHSWEDIDSDLDDHELVEVYGKKVPVERVDALIAYKTKLSRDVDIEDVRQLALLAR